LLSISFFQDGGGIYEGAHFGLGAALAPKVIRQNFQFSPQNIVIIFSPGVLSDGGAHPNALIVAFEAEDEALGRGEESTGVLSEGRVFGKVT
jgi:hypothetical protein